MPRFGSSRHFSRPERRARWSSAFRSTRSTCRRGRYARFRAKTST
jgi:hypothetical protein